MQYLLVIAYEKEYRSQRVNQLLFFCYVGISPRIVFSNRHDLGQIVPDE